MTAIEKPATKLALMHFKLGKANVHTCVRGISRVDFAERVKSSVLNNRPHGFGCLSPPLRGVSMPFYYATCFFSYQ